MKILKRTIQYLIIGLCSLLSVLFLNLIYEDYQLKQYFKQKPQIQNSIGDLINVSSRKLFSGTVFVVKYQNKKYGVTAGHICETLYIDEVYRIEGGASLIPLFIDMKNDICILNIFNGDFLKGFSLHETNHDFYGKMLKYVGYPSGNYAEVTGRFLHLFYPFGMSENFGSLAVNVDCEVTGFMVLAGNCIGVRQMFATTMITDFGASGSPVFLNGEIVGMLTNMNVNTKYAIFISINKVILNLKRDK